MDARKRTADDAEDVTSIYMRRHLQGLYMSITYIAEPIESFLPTTSYSVCK